MKSLPIKKIVVGIVAAGVFVLAILYFLPGKGSETVSTTVNPAFAAYISSYTAGVVPSGSRLQVIMASDYADSTMIGKEASAKLFDLSPSVSGKVVWINPRTVEFTPDQRLRSGEVYEAKFQLAKLLDVPDELRVFTYSFQVIPQNYEVQIVNVKPYINTELKRQKVEGILNTADFAEPASVEKMLSANQEGKSLNVSWTHSGDGKRHDFVIEEVTRKEKASKVSYEVEGSHLSVDRDAKSEVNIPALGDFKVVATRLVQSPSQYVILQFSDPLKESQTLGGLITLQGQTSLDFDIRDNEVWVYPAVRQAGTKRLFVEPGIRNILDYRMKQSSVHEIVFEQEKPEVRFTGKGAILPSTDGMVLPFEAVSLKSVDVEIIKIFESNVLQFLQVNDYDGKQELRRVGKPILKKTISLESSGVTDLGKWNRFTLDLSQMINSEPGAIYQVKIGFRRSSLAYVCTDGEVTTDSNDLVVLGEDEWSDAEDGEGSYWDSYEDYYYPNDYQWSQRENPCHVSYYTPNRTISKNILASDLGLLAKRGADGSTIVFVNDLKTTSPLASVNVDLYNYQQQVIGSGTTDADGRVVISSRQKPFVLVAKNGTQRGYLRLRDGESLSLSNFDVGGEAVNRGLKGFIYGERGVWRPGDSLHVSFILEDKLKTLPENHPVIFELQNPQGQIANRQVQSGGQNGFYYFGSATSEDDPTGDWTARIKVGGVDFTKSLKIETVKPNRLKINLDFGVDKLTVGKNDVNGQLKVNWLHGAPGKNLRAQFDVVLTAGETKFDRYPDYTFSDPSRKFEAESQTIFDGYTDAAGNAIVNASLDVGTGAPGMLNAVFRGKVYEESGNFSVDRFSIPYYPYSSFTGIRLPPGDKARGMLLTDTTHTVDVVTLDADGKPVSRDAVQMSIYKLSWRWWWDNSSQESVNYMSGQYSQALAQSSIKTVNGKGTWDFKIKYPEWGRYLVKAFDPVSGHSTAKIVYIDWPGWAGRAREGAQGATMLSFSSDKTAYSIGEDVVLTIPGSDNGRALISIENGSKVIQSFWLQTKSGDNPFSFPVTREMTPNVFVSVTLLQPHTQTANSLPIRQYGVIPISVEDPQTHLQPVISMPDVLEPGQEVTIKISEATKQKMTYTIAVVEEGLLDLTRYKTPDPWKRFYAREAIGVKTWDLYDDVIGAFGARIERLLAVGGDDEAMSKEDDSKANRFKPVVKYMGPYTLDGGSRTHKFIMPQYIGSVKTMVVAGYAGAYGNAEKATPVRKPLMVLATLPRVLGPEEKVKLPVTLFTMDPSVKNVKVDIKVTGPLQLRQSSQSIVMNDNEQTILFDLDVRSALGMGKVEVTASSGSFKSTDVIDIEIRNPNPEVTKVQDAILEAGRSWNAQVIAVGMKGTNTAILEISSLPPINLGQRLKYLMQYPYGCIEQTTSSVFPQLYLSNVKVLTDAEKSTIQNNVKAGIDRLKSFTKSDGGFSYWPGGDDSDSWGSTYAGHFLVEAEANGYYVPADMMRKWRKYQRNKAQAWRKSNEYANSELMQAYRLYTLALAGDSELGAMNRLREQNDLSTTASWMLAAAYAKAGQPEAAKTIIAKLPRTVKPYQEMDYSYGSDLRDKAIIMETLVMLNDRNTALQLLKEMSESLSNANYWCSTQTIAWCLKAVGSFVANNKQGELKFRYSYNGKDVNASTELPIAQVELPVDAAKSNGLKVESQSEGTLFVRLIGQGIPARGSEDDAANNLAISVAYEDLDGNRLDVSNLEQGTQFLAVVSVSHPGVRSSYKNMALNQVFPSGWEINNARMDGTEDLYKSSKFTYQDIRDDRVYTYFDLAAREKKVFKVLLTATYAGNYYLPGLTCEAMYDHSIYARVKGQVVDVVRPAGVE